MTASASWPQYMKANLCWVWFLFGPAYVVTTPLSSSPGQDGFCFLSGALSGTDDGEDLIISLGGSVGGLGRALPSCCRFCCSMSLSRLLAYQMKLSPRKAQDASQRTCWPTLSSSLFRLCGARARGGELKARNIASPVAPVLSMLSPNARNIPNVLC